jgi:Flp pilus assembly protein TadD
MEFSMWKVLGSSLVLAAALAGCASTTTKSPTAREAARLQWNDAQSTVLIGLASDQYQNGDFEKSRSTIDQALRLTPTSPAAHILSAKLYIEAGQLQPAEGELSEARKLDPGNGEADYLCGVIYQRWQQPERALEFYQSACTKNPAELAYVLAKAEMLVSMDCRDQALTLLQSRMAYFEHSGQIRDEVGLLLVQEGRYPEAIDMFRRAGILESDDLTIKEHLAMALFFSDRYSEAGGILSDLMADAQFSHRSDLMIMLGECQLQTAHASDAVVTFQQASEISPDSTGVWIGLGRAEMQTNSLRQAELALRHGLALDAKSSEGHLLLGYVELRQGQVSDAYASFTRANQLDPSDTVSLCMVGLTLDRMGRKGQAADCFNQALRMKPGDQMAGQLLTNLDEGR